MVLRRRSFRPWPWEAVRDRTLAIYRRESEGRERTAVLVFQGDDPQVAVGDSAPPLLAITIDAEEEAGDDNTIALRGFDSLEAARAHCIEWAGTADEAPWESLGEAAQVGAYATIREPGFADRG